MSCENLKDVKEKNEVVSIYDDLIKQLSISIFNQVIYNQMEEGI